VTQETLGDTALECPPWLRAWMRLLGCRRFFLWALNQAPQKTL